MLAGNLWINSQCTNHNLVPPQSVPPIVQKRPAGKVKNIVLVVVLLIVFAVMIVGGILLSSKKADKTQQAAQSAELQKVDKRVKALESEDTFSQDQVEIDKWQAVFLTSGQVYFGKITKTTKDNMKLEQIYYLKTGSVDKAGNPVGNEQVSLVRLGKELHAPEDNMIIERKNVTFWENLKSDGQIAQAIITYQKQNPSSN